MFFFSPCRVGVSLDQVVMVQEIEKVIYLYEVVVGFSWWLGTSPACEPAVKICPAILFKKERNHWH